MSGKELLHGLGKPGPLPNFRYRIDSLRVDGDQSADPQDYSQWPLDEPVGRYLHAFLTAELRRKLLSSKSKGVMKWSLDGSRVLAVNPTRRTLEEWAAAKYVTYHGCGGEPTPLYR